MLGQHLSPSHRLEDEDESGTLCRALRTETFCCSCPQALVGLLSGALRLRR